MDTNDVISFYGVKASMLTPEQTPNWYAMPTGLSNEDLAVWLESDFATINQSEARADVNWLEVAEFANQKMAYRSAYCKHSVIERALRKQYKR